MESQDDVLRIKQPNSGMIINKTDSITYELLKDFTPNLAKKNSNLCLPD
jgi:hypothetical protein